MYRFPEASSDTRGWRDPDLRIHHDLINHIIEQEGPTDFNLRALCQKLISLSHLINAHARLLGRLRCRDALAESPRCGGFCANFASFSLTYQKTDRDTIALCCKDGSCCNLIAEW